MLKFDTCRVDEYLVGFFFVNFAFWALGTRFFLYLYVCPKTLGQSSEVKSGLGMLKFGTLVDWMNTILCLCQTTKNVFFPSRKVQDQAVLFLSLFK